MRSLLFNELIQEQAHMRSLLFNELIQEQATCDSRLISKIKKMFSSSSVKELEGYIFFVKQYYHKGCTPTIY